MRRCWAWFVVVPLIAFLPRSAHAGGEHERHAALSRGEPPVWLDVEVDPFAYLLEGHSVHVGLRMGQLRFDLGTFAARYPEFLAANGTLDGRESGVGLKIDWRFAQRASVSSDWVTEFWRGPFVGVGVAHARLVVTDPASQQAAAQFRLHASARAGWDIPIASGFYLVPWASLGPIFGAEPLVVAGQRWDTERFEVFATLHLGWRSPWL